MPVAPHASAGLLFPPNVWHQRVKRSRRISRPADPNETRGLFNASHQQKGYYHLKGLDYGWTFPHARHPGTSMNILWADGHVDGFSVADKYHPYDELGDKDTNEAVDLIPNRWDTRK